jgi:hypothetical protein
MVADAVVNLDRPGISSVETAPVAFDVEVAASVVPVLVELLGLEQQPRSEVGPR